jgi:CBS domain-containing protein
METRDYYRTDVATAPGDATAVDLVDRMAHFGIGSVVIVDGAGRPVGIVTDRDLTCRVVAKGADPKAVRASEIMSAPLVTCGPSDAIEVAIERMRGAGVRRLPVVREGQLTGLVAIDDFLVELGRELDDLAEAARREVEIARRRGRRERRREDLEESLGELRASVERAGRDAAEFVSREFESLRERLRRATKS